MVRKITCKLLEQADEGMLSWQTLAECALRYMSEDEVAEMARANELIEDEEDDEDEDPYEHDEEVNRDSYLISLF